MAAKLSALLALLLCIQLSAVQAQATKPPLPPHDVITAENASDIVPLMRLGRGNITTRIYWTSDNKYFVAGGQLGIWVYDAHNPTDEPRLLPDSTHIGELILSPDGKSVINSYCARSSENYVCDESRIQFWDIQAGTMVNEFKIGSSVGSVTLSADASKLGYVETQVDPASPNKVYPNFIYKVHLIQLPSGEPLSVADSIQIPRLIRGAQPDQIWGLARTSAKTLELWDVTTGIRIREMGSYSGDIVYEPLDVSSDARWLALKEGQDKKGQTSVGIWNLTTGENVGHLQTLDGDPREIKFSKDGSRLAVITNIQKVDIWSIPDLKFEKFLSENGAWGGSADWSPDGKEMITTNGFGIKLWQIEQSVLRLVLDEGHSSEPLSLAFSPDGIHLVSGGGSVILWDIQSGKELRIFQSPSGGGYTSDITYSPDGQLVTALGEFIPGDGGCECDVSVLNVWNALTGDLAGRILGHGGQYGNEIGEAAFSPDGKYITIANPPTVWNTDQVLKSEYVDVDKGQETHRLFDDYVQGKKASYSVDGKTVAISDSDGGIQFWDATTGIKQKSLTFGNRWIWDIAYSPDGRLFAATSSKIQASEDQDMPSEFDDHNIKIWDVKTDQMLLEIKDQPHRIDTIGFSPDGKLLVSGSENGSTRIWDVVAGKQVALLQINDQIIWDVAFSPDGKLIATASRDGTVRLWGVPTD